MDEIHRKYYTKSKGTIIIYKYSIKLIKILMLRRLVSKKFFSKMNLQEFTEEEIFKISKGLIFVWYCIILLNDIEHLLLSRNSPMNILPSDLLAVFVIFVHIKRVNFFY